MNNGISLMQRADGFYNRLIIVAFIAVACMTFAAQPIAAQSFWLQNAWCVHMPTIPCGRTGEVSQTSPLFSTTSSTYVFAPGATAGGSQTESSFYGQLASSGTGTATVDGKGNGANVGVGLSVCNGCSPWRSIKIFSPSRVAAPFHFFSPRPLMQVRAGLILSVSASRAPACSCRMV